MKPKLIDWIPIYGDYTYFRRYFKGQKHDYKDAELAHWFSLYHIVMALLIIGGIICLAQKYLFT